MEVLNMSRLSKQLEKRRKPRKARRKAYSKAKADSMFGVDGRPIVINPVHNFKELLADNILSVLLKLDGYTLYNNMETGELIVSDGVQTHSLDATVYNYKPLYGYSKREDIHGHKHQQLAYRALAEGAGILSGLGIGYATNC